MAEVESKKSKMDVGALKERNYRMVELIRQLNAREQKRLDRNTEGIQAKCRWQLDQVSDEQRRIKRELVQVRNSTTTTWGFLPPRKGLKQAQPPEGLDQFQMEQFAKQLYDIKPKKKEGRSTSPESASRRGAKNPVSFKEEDEFNASFSDDDDMIHTSRSPQKSPSKRSSRSSEKSPAKDSSRSPQKSPSKHASRTPQRSPTKPVRTGFALDLKKAQNKVVARLAKPHSLHNTPVNSPHARSKSMTDRGPRNKDNTLAVDSTPQSTWRLDTSPRGNVFRVQSLPPLNRVKEKKPSKVAWANTDKSVKFQSSKPSLEITVSDSSETLNKHTPKAPMGTQNVQQALAAQKAPNAQQAPTTQKAPNAPQGKQQPNAKSKSDTTQSEDQKRSFQQKQVSQAANQKPNQAANQKPAAETSRTLTPIRENPAIERQSTNASDRKPSDLTLRRPSLNVAKKPKKKSENSEKKEDKKENGFDREKYNPDGSLRTIHTLPNFQESLDEALKARYLRNRYKLWHEREMSVSECWSEQNLPWKKVAT